MTEVLDYGGRYARELQEREKVSRGAYLLLLRSNDKTFYLLQ